MSHSYSKHTAATYGALQRIKSASVAATDDKRRRYIKAIKTKQRQLGMDEDTYRAMLLARTGNASLKDCSITELGNVSSYLTAQGAVNPKGMNPKGRPPAGADARLPLRRMVDGLMADLARVTPISSQLAYVNAILLRNHWCSEIGFADEYILHKLVGVLQTTLKAKTRAANQTA